jgi:hypothetical protein
MIGSPSERRYGRAQPASAVKLATAIAILATLFEAL